MDDPVKILKQDHQKVKELFKQFEDSTDKSERKAVLDKILKELSIHTAIEEQYFYPKLINDLKDEITQGIEEHNQVNEQAIKLQDMEEGSEEWLAVAKVIMEDVKHHIEEEESVVLPKAEQILDADTKQSIAREMIQTKTQES